MPRIFRQHLSEDAMQAAERRIPELAARAGWQAYRTSLTRTGAAVVKSSQGLLVERHIDGTVIVIKALTLGTRVKKGTVLKRPK